MDDGQLYQGILFIRVIVLLPITERFLQMFGTWRYKLSLFNCGSGTTDMVLKSPEASRSFVVSANACEQYLMQFEDKIETKRSIVKLLLGCSERHAVVDNFFNV